MSLIKKIDEKIPKEKRLTLILAIGLLGIAFVIFFDFDNDNISKKTQNVAPISLETDEYKISLETELTSILEQIKGVGQTKVMLTIEGTTEYIYAQENIVDNKENETILEEKSQNKFVLIENQNQKEALVKKIIKPKVNGVIVVCEGGDSPIVNEKVYKAVSTVLDISSSKVCVVAG